MAIKANTYGCLNDWLFEFNKNVQFVITDLFHGSIDLLKQLDNVKNFIIKNLNYLLILYNQPIKNRMP